MNDILQQISSVLSYSLLTIFNHEVTVGEVLIVPTAVIVAWYLIRRIGRLMVKRMLASGVSPDSVHLFKRAFYIIAGAIVVVSTLELLNVPLTAFAFLSGAVAIGVGFGAQNIINNFISGWILMWERPIRIGDFLEVDGARGKVESINTRSTRIRRVDGVHMLIPNSKLLENTVINWTLIDRLTRTSVRVGVAYGSDVHKVHDLITRAVNTHEDILAEPSAVVIFDDFGDNALMFEAFFWVNATVERDLRLIRSQIRFAIDGLFNEAGVVIAFPQRDVHIDGAIRIQRKPLNS